MNDELFLDSNFSDNTSLLNDKEIARLLNFSTEWVRQQRRLRRTGQKHALTIDPVMVGEKPRYDRDEFMGWYERLKATKRPPENSKILEPATV